MERLHPSRLDALPDTVARTRYDRASLSGGIVHLGVGAFPRAHLAAATEAALAAASSELRWGIVGVSLRSPDTRDALAVQQGLYTLALRDTDEHGAPREQLQVIRCLIELLVAPENPGAVHARIANEATRIVSLTVTEKGYLDTTRGSTLDVLAQGLALRRSRDAGGITLLSLDNLPSNGEVLRERLLGHVRALDGSLADWIETHCTFPCSMVDRIVPRTTDADRERISARLGLEDAWPVVGEPFFDWVIEDRFAAGRPTWQHGGARFVSDAKPFETLKLRMVNGAHSALAYLGAMAGWRTVDRAAAEPAMQRYLDTMMRDEITPTLPTLPGLDLEDYRARLLQRFANPALQHQTEQIAIDGSHKLPQRLLGTVRDRIAAGHGYDRIALAIAGWLHYLSGTDETGATHEIADPLAAVLSERLTTISHSVHDTVAHVGALEPVFGELGRDARFVSAVARHLVALRQRGVRATLEAQP